MRWYLSLCIGSRNSFRYAAERRGMSSALVFSHQGGERSAEDSRRGLIGRPEGRPRPERVLKDAGAPPSFRTDPAAEAGLQPVRSPVPTPNDLFQLGRDQGSGEGLNPSLRRHATPLPPPRVATSGRW